MAMEEEEEGTGAEIVVAGSLTWVASVSLGCAVSLDAGPFFFRLLFRDFFLNTNGKKNKLN